jgi:3-dehydroquinate dehydratase-2
MKILVVNGPNLGLLGKREPGLYGTATLEDIVSSVVALGEELGVEIDTLQSNEEGALITAIGESGEKYDGVLFNPGGYTHTSVALRDAVTASGLPCVELHLSNVHAREEFRHISMIAPVCIGQVLGFGPASYLLALRGLVDYLGRNK